MPSGRKKHSKANRKIALRKIEGLFVQAKRKTSSDMALSDRYVEIARKIAMKQKVKIPSVYKRQFCKTCHSFLMPGKNCRVRLSKKNVVYFCSRCKSFTRFGYRSPQKKPAKCNKPMQNRQ
jgi:ribonuclease P protein subunit RPR2